MFALILSLSHDQMERIRRDQIEFEYQSFIFFSDEFKNTVKDDVVQFYLFQASQIWKIKRGDFLLNPQAPLNLDNLKVPAQNFSHDQKDKENLFISKLQQLPQFVETLSPAQERILFSVMQMDLPLKYFFVSINERQLTDFDKVHNSLKDDIDRRQLLMEISHSYPNKLKIQKTEFRTIDKVFSYKTEIQKTIDTITSLRTFFFLTELPDEFTEDFSIDQVIRYGNIIEQTKRAEQIEIYLEEFKDIQPKDIQQQTHLDEFKRMYQIHLMEIKQLMLEFIREMDIHEVYMFVNMFPFLIDKDALREMIQATQMETQHYNIEDQEEGEQSYSFEESSSSIDSASEFHDVKRMSRRESNVSAGSSEDQDSDKFQKLKKIRNESGKKKAAQKRLTKHLQKMDKSGRHTILKADPQKYFALAQSKQQQLDKDEMQDQENFRK